VREVHVSGGPTPEEGAAIAAALSVWLGVEAPAPVDGEPRKPWIRRTRLEAQGIPGTPRAMARGWDL
jgi:hypothetical protein